MNQNQKFLVEFEELELPDHKGFLFDAVVEFEYEIVDDSFDHEFGIERINHIEVLEEPIVRSFRKITTEPFWDSNNSVFIEEGQTALIWKYNRALEVCHPGVPSIEDYRNVRIIKEIEKIIQKQEKRITEKAYQHEATLKGN